MAITLSTEPGGGANISNPVGDLVTPEARNKYEAELMRPAEAREAEERAKLEEWQRETKRKVDEAARDFENFQPGKSEAGRKRFLIRRSIEAELGWQPKNLGQYRLGRGKLARQVFEMEESGNDDVLFSKIQERATARGEEAELFAELQAEAIVSALSGWSKYDSMTGAATKNNEKFQRNPVKARAFFREQREKALEVYADILDDVRELNRAIETDQVDLEMVQDLVGNRTDEELGKIANALGMIQSVQGAIDTTDTVGGSLAEKAGRDAENLGGKAWRGAIDLIVEALGFGADSQMRTNPEVSESIERVKEGERNRDRAEGFLSELMRVRDQRLPIHHRTEEGSFARDLESALYATPGVGVTIGMAMVPGLGQVATAGLLEQSARENYYLRAIDAKVDRETARELAIGLSGPTAFLQYIPERVGVGAVTRRLPALKRLTEKLPGMFTGRLAELTARGAAETGTEEVQEMIQQLGNDVLNAVKDDIPEADWDEHWKTFGSRNLQTFLAIVPYTALGAMATDRRLSPKERAELAEQFAQAEDETLLAMGAKPEDVAKVRRARGPAEMVTAVDDLVKQMDPNSETAKDAVEAMEAEAEAMKEAEAEARRAGIIPRIDIVPGTDRVNLFDNESGEIMGENLTAQEAAEMTADHLTMREASRQAFVDSLVAQVQGNQVLLENRPDAVAEVRPTDVMTEMKAAEEFRGSEARLRHEVEMAERLDGGTGAVSMTVFGAATPRGYQNRAEAVNKQFGGSSLFTAIHEHTHETRRRLQEDGVFSKAEQVRAIQEIDAAISTLEFTETRDGERVKVSGAERTFLPADFDSKTEREQEELLDEAFSQLAEVMVLRTRNGEKTRFRELLSKNLAAQAKMAKGGPLTKLMAFVRAMREYFALNLQRAELMKRAERSGELNQAKMESLQALLFDTTPQEEYEAEVISEYEKNFVPTEEVPFSVGGSGFSISPAQDAAYLAAVEAGDMEAAQKMVDAAARGAGYDSPKVFHGSGKVFHVFKTSGAGKTSGTGAFFSSNEETAKTYGVGGRPKIVSARLNLGSPAVIYANGSNWNRLKGDVEVKLPSREVDQSFDAELLSELTGEDYPTSSFIGEEITTLNEIFNGELQYEDEFASTDDVVRWARNSGADSVIIQDVVDRGSSFHGDREKANRASDLYAVFNPSQIKSADPVTYDEAGNVIPLSERFNESSDDIRFSLGDSAIAGAIVQDVSQRVRSPEARAQIMGDIKRRVAAIQIEAERMRQVFGKEDQKIVVDPKAMKELREEAKVRRVARQEELEDEILRNEGGILAMGDQMTLRDMPVHGYIAKPGKKVAGGELESKSAFTKRTGKLPGAEYEGSEGMAGIVIYGGSRSPDQMAQELYGEGLIPDADPATMWEALRTERTSVKSMRGQYQKAMEAMRGAKKQAKLETDKWLEEQKALQLRDQNPMERMRRSLKMLDAILLALPVELRGKVGGFVQLANVETDEARLKELLKRVEKIDQVVEQWLKDEFTKDARRLLKRASAARQEAGKTEKGKHDHYLHEMFDRVGKAMTKSGAEVEAEALGIEATIDKKQAAGELSAAEETQLEQMALLVRLFGNWKNANASDREAAIKAGWRVFQYGYNRAVTKRMVQREAWREQQRDLIADTGKKGTAIERDRMETYEDSWRNLPLKLGQGFLDFGQALGITFGEDSETANRFEEWDRESDYQKKDRMFSHQMAVQGFFTDLADGDTVKGLKKQYELQTKKFLIPPTKRAMGRGMTGERELTQGQMIQARMMWRQPDGRRHMEGHDGTYDQEGNQTQGPSSWSYSEEFMDEIDKRLSDDARMLERFLTDQYGEEYRDLNEVHERVNGIKLPENPLYSPLTVSPKKGKSKDVIDPLTGQTVSGNQMTPTSIIRRSQSAVAEPEFLDALHTFYAHKTQIEHWMAYAELTKELDQVLNDRDVQNSVQSKSGVEGLNTLGRWQEILATGGVRDSAMTLAFNQAFQRGMGRLAQAALVGRLSVLAIQSTQLGASLANMPTTAYLKRVGKLAMGRLNWRETMKSEFIQRRMKEAPPAVRMAMEQLRTAKPTRAKYLAHKMGQLISGADAFFTSATYAMIYDYQTTELGQDPETAHREAEKLTEKVAQPVRSGKRSLFENMARNPFFTLAFAFASEGRQKFMLAAYAAFTGRTKAEKARAFAVAWGFGGAMAAVIRAIMADVRDDEDDELFDEKHWNPARLMAQTLAGPFSGIPFAGDFAESAAFKIFRMLGMKPGYLPEGNLMDAVPKGFEAAGGVAEKIFTDEEYEDTDEVLRDAEVILTGLAPFNDSAAAYTSFSHLGRDLFRIGKNVAGDD